MRKRVVWLSVFFAFIFSGNAMAIELDALGGVDIHGFLSQGYLSSDENNFFAPSSDGTPRFNEMGLNFNTDVTDRLHMGIQLFARQLGDFGENKIEVDWAYADYNFYDWLGLRVGKMKMPHGLYNTTRDIDFLRTSIFLPQSVYNEAWRDTVSATQGVGVYGDVDILEMDGSFDYILQGGYVKFDKDGGVATTTRDQQLLLGLDYQPTDAESIYVFTGALNWTTPISGWRIGTSFWFNRLDLEGESTVVSPAVLGQSYNVPLTSQDQGLNVADVVKKYYGVDIPSTQTFSTFSRDTTFYTDFVYDNLTLAAEYSRNRYDFELKVPGIARKRYLTTDGWYVSAAYRFVSWFELGVYYSEYYADSNDKDGDKYKRLNQLDPGKYVESDAWLKDTCMTFRFDITSHWVAKLEGHLFNGTAILMKEENMTWHSDYDYTPEREEDWYLLAAKLTYSF